MRIAAFVGMTLLVLAIPVPAHANVNPTRYSEPSLDNAVTPKTQSVTCPGTTVAFGMGGRVKGGNTELSAVTVSSDLKTVTVTARSFRAGTWSLNAEVVCAEPRDSQPEKVIGLGTAECTDGRVVFSSGFNLLKGDSHIRSVIPSADMSRVDVHASSGLVMAVGICAYPGPDPFIDYARVAVAGDRADMPEHVGDPADRWMYGAGVVITGSGLLDGFGVNSALDAALSSTSQPFLARLATDSDTTTIGTYSGFWYSAQG